MLNIIVGTRSNITTILLDIRKWTSRLTYYNLKLSKKNYALTSLNIWTTKKITRPTPPYASSRNTTLIKSSIARNIKKSRRPGTNQFA